MTDAHHAVTTDGEQVTVTLDRPGAYNALPVDAVDALVDAIRDLDRTDGSVVVVRGAGDHFSVGADLDDLDPADDAEARALSETYVDLTLAVRECPLPVVAAVQGRALGFGFLLALAADLVVATEDATFAVPEVRLGIPISGLAVALLPRLVGERRARDWLLTGRDVSAAEALSAGFVSRTAASDDLDEAVADLTNTLEANSGHTIAALKRRLGAPVPSADVSTLREEAADAMARAFDDGDARGRLDEFRS
ncbi:enoyl-CoA hydratase/isomerase family protein [Halomarina salina]|uniref:Enoyl-CoA hydratase/isomerase family protein n=1 Tax=Halomarina salina TaxID=1872699 RepID=A0ABD5RTQ0_9EURY|nr:enoyl-CoA hydratase/isomerase family protein [Halomarina salina]